MRNMDYIGISQSIGRVIRLGGDSKTFGLVCIPTYDSVGIGTARKVQAVVDTVFNKGQPAISEIVDDETFNTFVFKTDPRFFKTDPFATTQRLHLKHEQLKFCYPKARELQN